MLYYVSHFFKSSKPYLRIQIPEDVHPGLLHHGKELCVILSPLHIPDVLAFKLQLLTLHLLTIAVDPLGIEVEQGQDTSNVDDG